MNKTEEFLNLYKELETVSANVYDFRDGGAVAKLAHRAEFKNIRAELDYIRDVRNLLTHRPRIGSAYAVEPTDAMLELLRNVIERIECPAVAESIMIRMEDILFCTYEDLVLPALKTMYDRGFSHIPIMEDGRVFGVFSDRTYIGCVISGEHIIDETTAFHEIKTEISLKTQHAETFLFAERDTPVSELSDLFDEAGKKNEKIGLIFITEHGKASEKLLGLVTAWDVAASMAE